MKQLKLPFEKDFKVGDYVWVVGKTMGNSPEHYYGFERRFQSKPMRIMRIDPPDWACECETYVIDLNHFRKKDLRRA